MIMTIEQVTLKGVLWTVFFVWVFFYGILGIGGRDDTDSKTTRARSGLSLYTDYGTGLQYIKGGLFGDIHPRLDADGNHIKIGDIK